MIPKRITTEQRVDFIYQKLAEAEEKIERLEKLMTRLNVAKIKYYLTPKANWIYFPYPEEDYPHRAESILKSKEDLL